MRRGLAYVLAAALVTGFVAAPPRPASAEDTAPPGTCADSSVRLAEPERGADGSVPKPRPHDDGRYTPILLVHGWTGKPAMWSEPIGLSTLKLEPNVRHSLLGNLQGLRGAAVYTLDYAAVAQKWFLDDGAGAPAFLAAERCLTAHSAFAGHKLVVVAHSMGGLIARWSLTDAAPDAAARRARTGLVVSLGTPYDGSIVAAIGTALADTAVRLGASVDKRFAAFVGVLHSLIALCAGVQIAGCDQLNYAVDWLAAAHAFAPDSPQMRSLAPWPAGSRVETLGNRTVVEDAAGLFFLGGGDVDAGDVIVPVDSATAGSHPQKVAECRLTASTFRAGWDETMTLLGLTAQIDARTHWLLGLLGTCFHSNEARLIQLTNEVLGAVASELRAYDEPPYAYTTATELVLAHGTTADKRVKGKFGRPAFTDDGRFMFAVNTGNGTLVAIDTMTGLARTLPCGCTKAVPYGTSRVAWIQQRSRVMQADLAAEQPAGAPAAVTLPARRSPDGSVELLSGVAGHLLVMNAGADTDFVASDVYQVDTAGQVRKVGQLEYVHEPTAAVGATAAHGPRAAYADGFVHEACSGRRKVTIIDLDTGAKTVTVPPAIDDKTSGSNWIEDLWWGGDDQLYAVVSPIRCTDTGETVPVAPRGVWRLDGARWVSADAGPLLTTRRLTARVKIVIPGGSDASGPLYVETIGAPGVKVAGGVTAVAVPPTLRLCGTMASC